MKPQNCFIILMSITYVLAKKHPIFLNETYKADFIKIKENNSQIFYFLFESRSEKSTDPLIFWLNGDLGFSSLISTFLENGPLKLQNDLSLAVNPFSWNNNAILVFVDMIVGTGFSQGTDDGQIPKNINDVVNDFEEFLEGFFEVNENYKGRKIYLSGFQFAGHWIPAIAEQIISKNNSNINLAGISIGNGIFDPYLQFSESISFAYQNNLIDEQEYELKKNLFSDCLEKIKEDGQFEEINQICKQRFEEIIFSEDGKPRFNTHDIRKKIFNEDSEDEDIVENLEKFLNQPDVMEAIFGDRYSQNKKWVQFSLVSVELLIKDLFINSSRAITNILQNNVSVLVYNGDQDFNYNWIGSEKWASELQWQGQGEKDLKGVDYQKWESFGEYKSVDNFVFLKIYQAGHFVLEDQPEASMRLINSLISGQFLSKVQD